MNFDTQAAHDLLAKLGRDPIEVRHWRQLLILCFDQKEVESLQALQVIVAAIEQIWAHKRKRAKEAHEAAKLEQRTTGRKTALPPLAVISIPLTARQKEQLTQLARAPRSPLELYRFALQLDQEFSLPSTARTVLQHALIECREAEMEGKVIGAIRDLDARCWSDSARLPAPPLSDVLAPNVMGVKSPGHQRPNAAVMIKNTGRLALEHGAIAVPAPDMAEDTWVSLQIKLEEALTRLQTQAASLCETAPRPLRLPRSIAPLQWLEFFEGHLSLLLSILAAQGLPVQLRIEFAALVHYPLPERTRVVLQLIGEISSSLAIRPQATADSPPPQLAATTKLTNPTMTLEDVFGLIDAGDLDAAESYLGGLIPGAEPADQLSEVWFHLGFQAQNRREQKRAGIAYRQACSLDPNNLHALFNAGMIQQEAGDFPAALESYERAVQLGSEQPKIWCNLGALYFQVGNFESSVDALQTAVRLKPDYARAWDNLASSLGALNQLDEAERCCHRALNLQPNFPSPLFKLGTIYFQRGKVAEAENSFRAVLEFQYNYPLAGYYLALILARSQRLAEALEQAETAAAQAGEEELPALAWNEVAFNLYEAGRFGEALTAYDRAIGFTPNNAVLWVDAGIVHHHLGQLQEAETQYRRAVELDPDLARGWHNLGAVLHELGRQSEAQIALQQAEHLMAQSSGTFYLALDLFRRRQAAHVPGLRCDGQITLHRH